MKKVVKKTSVLLFALILVVCMALPVSAASISKKKVTICTGQTIQLKVNGVKRKARWTSSNKSVATVTQKGKVSAKKKGTTTVTAKIGKKKYACKVTVESPKLSKTSITVKNGKTYQLKMQNTKQKYKWSSKNKSIATVTSKGKVTGKKTGTTYIYAKSASGKIFKCKVIVKKSASSGGSFSDGSGWQSPSGTTGQRNALARAKSYLRSSSFSYESLIHQLEYEGFSNADATYAVRNCGANWYEQALKKANSYLRSSSFSYSGLIHQLEYEKFTSSQAKYGVDNCGANWYEQAAKKAASYMRFSSFSRDRLIEQLTYEGFTVAQAEYGASAVGY